MRGRALLYLLAVFLVFGACCLDSGHYIKGGRDAPGDVAEIPSEGEASSPPSSDYYASKIDTAIEEKDFEKALVYSNEGLVQFPDNALLERKKVEALTLLANRSLEGYEYEDAIGYAKMGLKLEKDYPLYWLKFMAEKKTGDYEDALATCNEALGLFPDDLRFIAGKAATQAGLKDHTGAIETVDSGLSLHQDDENLLELRQAILGGMPCSDDDGFCPQACNAMTDGDCKTYDVGETAVVDEGLELTLLSDPEPKRYECWIRYDSKSLADSLWGFAFRTKIRAENRANATWKNVGYYSFNLIDADGSRYETTGYLTGTCKGYAGEMFEMQDIMPDSVVEKEVWFGLGRSSIPPKPYYVVWDPSVWTIGEEIVWKAP